MKVLEVNLKDIIEKENVEKEYKLNEEINKRIYEHSNLKDYGIEFNSCQFKNWLLENSKYFPVPVDAPALIRKLVYETIDANKDSRCWFNLLKNFTREFREIKDVKDSNLYLEAVDKMLKSNKDYLDLLLKNSMNDPKLRQSIDDYSELGNELRKFKGKIKNIY